MHTQHVVLSLVGVVLLCVHPYNMVMSTLIYQGSLNSKHYLGPLFILTGFTMNLDILLSYPDAKMDMYASRGYLESSLLVRLVTLEELEPKGDVYTKVCSPTFSSPQYRD